LYGAKFVPVVNCSGGFVSALVKANAAAIVVLLSITSFKACAAQDPPQVTCHEGEKWTGEMCADAVIVGFKACVGVVASNFTEERRVRLEAEVLGALKAVGGKGAVEFADKVVRETSDPVNLKVLDTCLVLSQRSGVPPSVQSGFNAVRREIESQTAELPAATVAPASGDLPKSVVVTGKNWPPGKDLVIRMPDGELARLPAAKNGTFSKRVNLPVITPAVAEDKKIVVITVSPDNEPSGSTLSVAVAYEVVPDGVTGTITVQTKTTKTSTTKSSPTGTSPSR
jgi:hypothetical protein